MNFGKAPEPGSLFPLLQHLLPTGPDGPQGGVSESLGTPEGAKARTSALGSEPFTTTERQFLLGLARQALHSAVTGSGVLPEVPSEDLAPKLAEPRACFVTLMKHGKLRGCVGQVLARAPLYQAVPTTTRSAALTDPRFSPVTAAEVTQIRIELSVLTEPQPLSFGSPEDLLQQLRPHEHGVVLGLEGRLATFLPQVWEQLPDKVEFLSRLAQKAGAPADAWRTAEASIRVYRVEGFEED